MMKPKGQLQYFRSDVDGKLCPCAVCATDTSDDPKPLLLEVSPGAISNLDGAVRLTEEIAENALRHGESCVVLRPTGRGPGSVYQNYGEVDVLEAIEHVCRNYAIDRDRISITGASMGGAATWYLISHYPDLFTAAAPFCGYCDYRLWEKPGGPTFHMHEWEEFSWKSRSAAFLIENLEHTPVWMVHGEWDRGVGGGVPVEHSRQMARLLGEKGFDHRYTEVPKTGHGCRIPEVWDEVVPWLLRQSKRRQPAHVQLKTFTLRHSRSFWVEIHQMIKYGRAARIEAEITEAGILRVITENVRTFSLGPLDSKALELVLDGAQCGGIDLRETRAFRRDGEGNWTCGEIDLSREKRPRCCGPIGDLFFEGAMLVPGTTGSEEETFFNNWVASNAAGFYRTRNGGVHRGGIPGENWVDLPKIPDAELSDEDRRNHNLILYGTDRSNAILGMFREKIGISFESNAICVGEKRFISPGGAIFAIFPHPENPNRYLAIHGGVTPDAICWGSHLDMHLLPDYIVYAGGRLIEWGFWRNDWTL